MADVNLTTVAELFKDMYPQPGERIKQWVVDSRREDEWERDTCPRFETSEHEDNTGIECRNSASKVLWTHLDHDCCSDCCSMYEALAVDYSVTAWLAEKAKRPPIEADRTKLSDEIQEDWAMREHPLLKAFNR